MRPERRGAGTADRPRLLRWCWLAQPIQQPLTEILKSATRSRRRYHRRRNMGRIFGHRLVTLWRLFRTLLSRTPPEHCDDQIHITAALIVCVS